MKMGIRISVLLLTLAPAALIAIVLVAYLIHTRIQDLEQSLVDRGQAIVNQLAPAYGMSFDNVSILRNLAHLVLQEADVNSVTILDAQDTILTQEINTRIIPRTDASLIDWIPLRHIPPLSFEAPIYRMDQDFSARPAMDSMAKAANIIGYVRLELSREATERRQREVIGTSILLTLSCLLLATILGQRIGRKVSDPIVRMEHAVRELRDGQLDIHVEERSSGELGSLERGINAMVAALKASHAHLQEQIDEATAELRETMEELEVKNAELDIARKKALQASCVKSEFLANMSHEIRTPMNGVMGFIELLAKTKLNRTQQGYLQTIRASAENLMVILNDILDFSKIEAGKFKIRKRPLDLREVLENAVLLFAANAQQKGLNLILDIEPDVPSNLVGDAPRIAQIVTNLVSNAIKSTDQGEVEVQVSKFYETPQTVILTMKVRDTGIGIALADQSRLFNAFDQLDNTTTRRHGGTGLGLAICQRLASLMQGSIHVESRPEIGSSFYVFFTLDKQDSRGTMAKPRPCIDTQILIISSDALLARAVAHILEFAGARPYCVTDFAAAASYLANTTGNGDTPKGIILDLGGLSAPSQDFLKVIQARMLDRNCVLIIVGTAEDQLDDQAFFQTFATLHFINKPPTLRELLPILDTLSGQPDRPSCIAATLPAAEQSTVSTIKAKVLLADDNLINRQLARIFLTQLGAQVDEVSNGREAVEACRHNRYDFILMDIHMPEMDGLEATRCIRLLNNNPNNNTPIIALTADAMDQERTQYLEAGMNDHLSKPITEAALQQILAKRRLATNAHPATIQ